MSDPESFAARWSRLKRATATEQQEAASVQPAAQPADTAPAVDTSTDPRAESDREKASSETPFDPKSLPSIDSIMAGSDIKAFLQAGVPKDLTRAALRRAWTADPAIRDFIGLAENQWDFTDPTAMPGFGPLEATDDVRQLVAQAMGRLADSTKVGGPDEVALASDSAQARDGAPREVTAALPTNTAMPEEQARARQDRVAEVDDGQPALPAKETGDIHGRRTHGGALPK
ncbi:MAG: DUF3306 domain-containing protein [Hyphomicrobiaceae bacterium]